MMKFFITCKNIILLISVSTLLTGCLGGSIAQQIARSIATSVADNAVANAMDVQESEVQDRFAQNKKTDYTENSATQQVNAQQITAQQNLALQNLAAPNTTQRNPLLQKNIQLLENSNFQQSIASQQIRAFQKNTQLQEVQLDPYKLAFANARFEELKPIAEPLPEQLTEAEISLAVVQSSQLVHVELFNLLIGEEKAAVYSKAQLLGATTLPKQREWKLWHVATGIIKSEKTNKKVRGNRTDLAKTAQIITFLIPPEFGKLPSGSIALVEIASPGELNIARYKMN